MLTCNVFSHYLDPALNNTHSFVIVCHLNPFVKRTILLKTGEQNAQEGIMLEVEQCAVPSSEFLWV